MKKIAFFIALMVFCNLLFAQIVTIRNQVRFRQLNNVPSNEVTLTGQLINQFKRLKQTAPARMVKVLLLYGNNLNEGLIDKLMAGSDVSNIDIQCRANGIHTKVSYTDDAGNYAYSQVPKNTDVYIVVFQNKRKIKMNIPADGSNYVTAPVQYFNL